jgi:hypothetical protein
MSLGETLFWGFRETVVRGTVVRGTVVRGNVIRGIDVVPLQFYDCP